MLLLSGTLLTGRDAAHKRMVQTLAAGEPLPINLRDKAIYYVGPVDAVRDEVIGPAGPTTASRMDGFLDTLLPATGLRVMIGKAERGPIGIEAIRKKPGGLSHRCRRGGLSGFKSHPFSQNRCMARSWHGRHL